MITNRNFEVGSYIQIGRNCLQDFCRDPELAASMCAYAEMMASVKGLCEGSEDEDFFGFASRRVERVETEGVLTVTARMIRTRGWLSKSKANDSYPPGYATASIVSDIFFDAKFFERRSDDSRERRELQEQAQDSQPEDSDTAIKALEWVRSQRDQIETLSDYMHNLLIVAAEETVTKKHFGILCSAVSAYQREVEKRDVERRKALAPSLYFGMVGKRETWTANVVNIREFESQYGVKHLVKLDINGNVAIWWASCAVEFEVGDEVEVKGTVKAHNDYQNTAQTELSRCKVKVLKAVD